MSRLITFFKYCTFETIFLDCPDYSSAELEMTVNMLIQIDKLVQLLESPVFTCKTREYTPEMIHTNIMGLDLRLQLLEPEKHPHLYKCLYGLLMLLPQSSAFAALKNRLNSVSAIGYLHIAPRTYVSQSRSNSVVEAISSFQFHQRQKSNTETHASSFSVPANAGPSNYDRSSRLKGRDEGGIRWTELLEKFRSVQDKARRAQRPGGDFDDMGDFRGGDGSDSRAFKDLRLQGPPLPMKDKEPPVIAQPPVPKSRTNLSRLGRLGGAVTGRQPKR